MSGHSKWATIRRKKEKTDAARGRVFSKIIKEITVAARMGGGDENSNPRLRTAVAAAKAANMPAGNIDRAVKKGTGELPGVTYEDVTYEAYGPGGTAIMIEVLTDNRNRTVGEIRHAVSKHGGNLGETGSVNWMFTRRGTITVPATSTDEDTLMMVALEAGAEDVKNEEESFVVLTTPESLESVRSALEKEGITVEEAEIAMIPQTYIKIEGSQARQFMKLVDSLEDHDDVQNVWSNSDIDDADMEEEE